MNKNYEYDRELFIIPEIIKELSKWVEAVKNKTPVSVNFTILSLYFRTREDGWDISSIIPINLED